MFNRILLFVILGIAILSLVGCAAEEEPKKAEQPAAAKAEAKPAEETVPVYEITKDEITSHPGWTSRNISVMGLKIGDKTQNIEKFVGPVENSRTTAEDYLTIHQTNGVFVYTFKITGKARKIEVNQGFAKKVADAKLQKLLNSGDMKTMHDVLGMEEGAAVDNTEDNSTEYPYDSRGFRFVKFKVGGKTLNAIRFVELKKTT